MAIQEVIQNSEPRLIPINGGAPATTGNSRQPLCRKVRLTVNLPTDLVEQMRDAVYWTPGLTLAWVIARAMRESLADLHATNRGPFPRRAKPLRAGRPRLTGQSMQVHQRASAPDSQQGAEPLPQIHAMRIPNNHSSGNRT
ncbi:hypothetical protein W02_28340 [Nitrospira sp. KM1]|uniref:hypothetical protein n=1 Tax=Nitrospira sp. KM1 TaxID=1936990 RepID=UPI0013A720D1|nr:hypothetical protein [Nitrospira sp. KM1]BCA55694.1 hypothetical protein W02_28340 [Nitrospira sp. KM1]